MKTADIKLSKGLFERSKKAFLIDIDESVKTKGFYLIEREVDKYSSIIIHESYFSQELNYFYKGELIGVIPSQLEFLLSVFKESESILNLENDWDDNGSSKYDIHTWKATIHFLIDYSTTLLDDFNTTIDKPKIYNGPRGSIDVLWEYDSYTFLVNIDQDGLSASFYADNTINTQRIRGEFKLDRYKKTLIPFAIQF